MGLQYMHYEKNANNAVMYSFLRFQKKGKNKSEVKSRFRQQKFKVETFGKIIWS